MAFKSDKQRKFVMGFVIINNKKVPITPQIIKDNKNLNVTQLRKKGIFLNPKKDIDKDGVKNIKDCKPLDKKRQGKLHDFAMNILHKKEQFLEKRRIKAMKKLEETREKLEKSRAVKQVKNQQLQAKQSVINEINKEKQQIQNLKTLNKQAKKEIFRQTLTGKAVGKSEAAIKKTQSFFAKPSTKQFLRKSAIATGSAIFGKPALKGLKKRADVLKKKGQ